MKHLLEYEIKKCITDSKSISGIILWKMEEIILQLPKCDVCIHRHDDNKEDTELVIYCDAFPNGKPFREIPGDAKKECANGIKYEDENGEYKEFVPKPGSVLSKMLDRL